MLLLLNNDIYIYIYVYICIFKQALGKGGTVFCFSLAMEYCHSLNYQSFKKKKIISTTTTTTFFCSSSSSIYDVIDDPILEEKMQIQNISLSFLSLSISLSLPLFLPLFFPFVLCFDW